MGPTSRSMETVTSLMPMGTGIGMERVLAEAGRSLILSSSTSKVSYICDKLKMQSSPRVAMDGTFENLIVLNSPAHAISVDNNAPLLIRGVTIDNSAGDNGNLGHNTDVCLPHLRNFSRDLLLTSHNSKGFDVSANNVTIENCIVKNQDDCIAINGGSNIVFQNNSCSGGHGISIGSISSGKTVSDVTISDNTVTKSMYGLRIKAQAAATSGSVSRIIYSGNTVSGISKYGVLITQSYPADFGSPGTKTTIRYVKAFPVFESVK